MVKDDYEDDFYVFWKFINDIIFQLEINFGNFFCLGCGVRGGIWGGWGRIRRVENYGFRVEVVM